MSIKVDVEKTLLDGWFKELIVDVGVIRREQNHSSVMSLALRGLQERVRVKAEFVQKELEVRRLEKEGD